MDSLNQSSNLVRCTVCNGRKEIMPLGYMVKKCPNCQGVGYVSVPIPIKEEVKPDIVEEPIKEETIEAKINQDSGSALADALKLALNKNKRY